MKPVAVYARLSVAGDENEEAGGIDRQLADAKQVAETLGATATIDYVDAGLSAYSQKKKRPAFERLLDDIKSGAVDLVVAWRMDRLARHPADAERLIEAIESRSPHAVVHTTDGIDTDTESGSEWLRLRVFFGRQESRGTAIRVRRKHESLAELGKWSGGPRGFGHRQVGPPEDRRTELDLGEAGAIQNATQRLLAGESIKSVLRVWKALGITTTRGGEWQHSALVKLLVQPRMAGLRVLNGREGSGSMPPILDRETWEQLVRLLTDPARKPSRPGGSPRHLLTGLMRCGLCGGSLKAHGNSGKRNGPSYSTYGCVADRGGCGRVWIKASHTDDYIAGLVIAALASPAVAQMATPGESADETALRREYIAKREELVTIEVESIEARYGGDRSMSDRAYSIVIDKRRVALEGIRTALAKVEGARALADAVHDPAGYWERASLEQRRALVSLVFPVITVARAGSLPEYPQRWDARRLTIIPAA